MTTSAPPSASRLSLLRQRVESVLPKDTTLADRLSLGFSLIDSALGALDRDAAREVLDLIRAECAEREVRLLSGDTADPSPPIGLRNQYDRAPNSRPPDWTRRPATVRVRLSHRGTGRFLPELEAPRGSPRGVFS